MKKGLEQKVYSAALGSALGASVLLNGCQVGQYSSVPYGSPKERAKMTPEQLDKLYRFEEKYQPWLHPPSRPLSPPIWVTFIPDSSYFPDNADRNSSGMNALSFVTGLLAGRAFQVGKVGAGIVFEGASDALGRQAIIDGYKESQKQKNHDVLDARIWRGSRPGYIIMNSREFGATHIFSYPLFGDIGLGNGPHGNNPLCTDRFASLQRIATGINLEFQATHFYSKVFNERGDAVLSSQVVKERSNSYMLNLSPLSGGKYVTFFYAQIPPDPPSFWKRDPQGTYWQDYVVGVNQFEVTP